MLTPQFLATLGATTAQGAPFATARGIACHTDRIRPGDAFFALPGERSHGIDFADVALAKGASFVVSDRRHALGLRVDDPKRLLIALGRYARDRLGCPVVGVTGSAGKTSTKALIAAALAGPASPGNFNTPLALSEVLVRHWLDAGASADAPLTLELGIDHVGEMQELLSIARPTHGVLTLIAPAHLDGLGDIGTIASEKGRLLEVANHAFASAQSAPLLPPGLRQRCTLFGLDGDPGAQVTITLIESTDRNLVVEYRGRRLELDFPGTAMARNLAGALAVASALGVDADVAASRLSKAALEPGRLQRLQIGSRIVIDDSYNSNPASAAAAIEVLRLAAGPRAAVLGDMLELGADAAHEHRELGIKTCGLDHVIAVGSHAQDLRLGNPDACAFATLAEAAAAIDALPSTGTVLVKGSRGAKMERVVAQLARTVVPS